MKYLTFAVLLANTIIMILSLRSNKNMIDRATFDAALGTLGGQITDIKSLVEEILTKKEAGEDFSAEMDQLNTTAAALGDLHTEVANAAGPAQAPPAEGADTAGDATGADTAADGAGQDAGATS